MLTDAHIDIVKSTIPLLENAGSALTNHFYKRMFSHNPELQDIFNMSNQHTGRQQVALFEAIAAYAKNIDNLGALTSAVERIAHKHTSFNIQAKHYEIVGMHLIETLRELAPEAFTSDVEEAWTQAYLFLAQIFITRESELYKLRTESFGGWAGTRKFSIIEKNTESELVTSFVFAPVDGKPVIDFVPGQYLGVEVTPTDSKYKEIRQYSLSTAANGKTYRISVKREVNGVPGLVSNYLHDSVNVGDEVNLYAPAGDFYFIDRKAPVVLLSAGVGITPMQSILETLAANEYSEPVHYLHACENSQQHSFIERVKQLTADKPWQQYTWYRNEESDNENIGNGVMDLSTRNLPLSNGDFYLCGPIGFMQFAKQQLLKLGVAEDRVHYEVFGPHAAL
ncbi:NO-inducible flavohemoprotein [Thalassomonas sp. M1454]|uniref:NO-inducible flavohemoprotein n=1 Tax=Thalassomonas sp. M1454 TaxID=2594477 RepID=UPI00117BF83F|nr:NO-inducible flavohemoprotein [Thalassomonas sp. M1454]TRX56459.1 NO-inducible flavohemoprotein [Thalassomonas sp. M1454]